MDNKPNNDGTVTAGRGPNGRFTVGNPGNRKGRRGSRNRATVALQSLLEADGERSHERRFSWRLTVTRLLCGW